METNQAPLDGGGDQIIRITIAPEQLKELLEWLSIPCKAFYQDSYPALNDHTYWLSQHLAAAYKLATGEEDYDDCFTEAHHFSDLPTDVEILPKSSIPSTDGDYESLLEKHLNLSRIWAAYALAPCPVALTEYEDLKFYYSPVFTNAIARAEVLPDEELDKWAGYLLRVWHDAEAEYALAKEMIRLNAFRSRPAATIAPGGGEHGGAIDG